MWKVSKATSRNKPFSGMHSKRPAIWRAFSVSPVPFPCSGTIHRRGQFADLPALTLGQRRAGHHAARNLRHMVGQRLHRSAVSGAQLLAGQVKREQNRKAAAINRHDAETGLIAVQMGFGGIGGFTLGRHIDKSRLSSCPPVSRLPLAWKPDECATSQGAPLRV